MNKAGGAGKWLARPHRAPRPFKNSRQQRSRMGGVAIGSPTRASATASPSCRRSWVSSSTVQRLISDGSGSGQSLGSRSAGCTLRKIRFRYATGSVSRARSIASASCRSKSSAKAVSKFPARRSRSPFG